MEEKARSECPWCGEQKITSAYVCGHCGFNTKGDRRVRVGFVSGMSIALGFVLMAPIVGLVVVGLLASVGYYR